MTDDNPETETQHNLNESADKIRAKTQVKRGTGTRDQDTHDLKVRADTPGEAAEKMSELVEEFRERDVFERVRAIENEDNGEEED